MSIQIQEGYLGGNGTINEKLVKWKDVEDVKKINDGVNAYKMDAYNNEVHLDDFQANPGYLLTGLKFDYINNNLRGKGALKLAIQITKYDYSTGKLLKDSSSWQRTYVPSDKR